jgi:hypothetical protein
MMLDKRSIARSAKSAFDDGGATVATLNQYAVRLAMTAKTQIGATIVFCGLPSPDTRVFNIDTFIVARANCWRAYIIQSRACFR